MNTAPLDTIIFQSHALTVGVFRCYATYRCFTNTGPISGGQLVVFPRTTVEITHAGKDTILTDPNTVMFYNEGQEYQRGKVSAVGDLCEWFAFSPSLLREALRPYDPHVEARDSRLFDITHGPSDAQSYILQRLVVQHILSTPHPDTLYIEETLLTVLERVVELAYRARHLSPRRPRTTQRAHAQLAHDAKELIAIRYRDPLSLDDIARQLYVSPYHLCRVFRAQAGLTLHDYLTQIRLRASLAPIADATDDVTQIALEYGFSSHSHFTRAFRLTFGIPPSTFRRAATDTQIQEVSKNLIA